MTTAHKELFLKRGVDTIRELETEKGILASGRSELYGCIFGRDSLITALKLLSFSEKSGDRAFLPLVKKILVHLAALQGTSHVLESGEEPGKCIHEFRPDNHEHLTGHPERPWYLYPDNVMRNYDSVDSTPLFLIALGRYGEVSGDQEFLKEMRVYAERALTWILEYGDKNGDGLIDYEFNPNRRGGGLTTQSWMDSGESLFHEDGSLIAYPVAPVEVQAYAYTALRIWQQFFEVEGHMPRAAELRVRADLLKERFAALYPQQDEAGFFLASAIDGNGKPLRSVRSSMGHLLWSAWKNGDGVIDSIISEEEIPLLVHRLMRPDLFEPGAGMRTLSTQSRLFESNSYHNGSIWPHDTTMIAEGMERCGYRKEAGAIRMALARGLAHFSSPVELFVVGRDGVVEEYCSLSGQRACLNQAWSAASFLLLSLHQEYEEQ